MGKIADGWRTSEANTLRALGYLPGAEGPPKVERSSTVDRHAEAQKRAKAENRARLLEHYGGKIPTTLPGRCPELAPKPKEEEIALAESTAGVKIATAS